MVDNDTREHLPELLCARSVPRAALCMHTHSSPTLFSFCPQGSREPAHVKVTNDCHLVKVQESYLSSLMHSLGSV